MTVEVDIARALRSPEAALEALLREDAERSLAEFTRQAWGVLEPSRPLAWGWALDAMCEHLEAVTYGEITRLLINVPPGMMKSLLVRVFWPCWEWITRPDFRYVGASYAYPLAVRDNRRAKMLFTSDFFQRNWGKDVSMSDDQSAKGKFENDQRGWMLATSVHGIGTGERGDRFTADDPNNVKESESTTILEETLQWFSEVVPTRLNDPKTSARIVIQQRTHARDVSGYILAGELDYVHLCLPMEYEPARKCVTKIGFRDPRTKPGELLFPERFDREDVDRLKKEFRAWGGTYAEAGQLQQNPSPREGGMFKAENFHIVPWVENAEPVKTIRYWDKAGTEGGGAYTAGVRMSLLSDGRYLVENVIRGQWSAGKRERMIKHAAIDDGEAVDVWIEQEPGSGGKESAQSTVRGLSGFNVRADKVSGRGSKERRAEPYAAQVEFSNVLLIEGPWNTEFIEEHRNFPKGQFKDQVDAAAGAFARLSRGGVRTDGLAIISESIENNARVPS